MPKKIEWDKVGEHFFEAGCDHGVLYPYNTVSKKYTPGVAWNGLTNVTETPSGAEANPVYADNIKYLNLYSAEEFAATIEALYYPDEFAECDGSAEPVPGVVIGQQGRKSFGLCYRTKLGNDETDELGYKLHLVWGCKASPSERSYGTINDSPETATFSWEVNTTPVNIEGYKPTSIITINSTKVDSDKLAALETLLYGSDENDAELPSPAEVLAMFPEVAG